MVCIAPIGVVGTEMTDGMWPEGWSGFGGLDCGALMGGTRTRECQGGFQIMIALTALNKKEWDCRDLSDRQV